MNRLIVHTPTTTAITCYRGTNSSSSPGRRANRVSQRLGSLLRFHINQRRRSNYWTLRPHLGTAGLQHHGQQLARLRLVVNDHHTGKNWRARQDLNLRPPA